jgi:hypothetical protein
MNGLPPKLHRWLVIILPPLSLAVCMMVMLPRQSRLRKIESEQKATIENTARYRRQVAEIKAMPLYPRIATMPLTKQEQSDFLRGLTSLCARTGNRLLNISSLSAPMQTASAPSGGTPPPADPDALPPDATEIKTTIVFEGTFDAMRSFMAGIKRSVRLVSLSHAAVTTSNQGHPILLTTLTVARYVDTPPEMLEAQKANQPAAPAKTS